MEVKKIVVIIMAILLIVPSFQSQKMNLSKLPSKDDIIGFMNAIQKKSKNFFYGNGNIMKDLFLLVGDINESKLEKMMEKFYEINNVSYNEKDIEEFLNETNLPEKVQQTISLFLYAYINASFDKNKIESAFLFLYATKETYYVLHHYKLNQTFFGPYGKIAIGGMENDEYSNLLFVIDFGGDDVYKKCKFVVDVRGNDEYDEMKNENSTYVIDDEGGDDVYKDSCYSINGTSFLFDLVGNDTYLQNICSSYENGYSILFDFNGNDVYRGGDKTQCFSDDGISILMDFNGDDRYYGNDYSQASTIGGDAILVDFVGEDEFIACNRSQAYAVGGSLTAVKGFATLINFAGSDSYIAGNYSQGYANSMGFALLLDFLGSDTYKAGGFSQASSNALGMAALIDNDGYNEFKHGFFSQGYMLGSLSLFANDFEMRGDEKLLDMINKLNFNFGNFFG